MDTTDITWLRPLFHDVAVGVDANGCWYMDDEPITGHGHLSLLPLMEPGYGGDYDRAVGMLVERLAEVGLPTSLADSFPFDAPVRLGLFGGGRWGELACEWLGFIQIDSDLEEQLQKVLDGRGLSRRALQQARRALEKWETEQFQKRAAERKGRRQ